MNPFNQNDIPFAFQFKLSGSDAIGTVYVTTLNVPGGRYLIEVEMGSNASVFPASAPYTIPFALWEGNTKIAEIPLSGSNGDTTFAYTLFKLRREVVDGAYFTLRANTALTSFTASVGGWIILRPLDGKGV